MKTKKIIFFASLLVTALIMFALSCENPVGLGQMLDLEGPVVVFITPEARSPQLPQFSIVGSLSDRSSIKELLLIVEVNSIKYAKQWRYKDEKWEFSQDFGNTWSPLLSGAKWEGSAKSADFEIPIDMTISGVKVEDGEYLFILQAWDSANNTDDNSYKTRVFIIDSNPPLVEISEPLLHKIAKGSPISSNPDLADLDRIDEDVDDEDNDQKRFDPSYIGKFLTQSFKLRWQIKEKIDIEFIDLYFYEASEIIDEDTGTDLPDNYIFRYYKDINSVNGVKPNGSIEIPALDGSPLKDIDNDGGIRDLKNPILGKTTIKIVSLCKDVADNLNLESEDQEKVLGYFVYWPKADKPWITFPDGMKELTSYGDIKQDYSPNDLKADTYMIYPGRDIKATAFHAYGLKEVKYTLYSFPVIATETSITSAGVGEAVENYINIPIENVPKPNGGYSTLLQWSFEPPARSGYFVLKAQAFSTGNQSDEYEMFFRVEDITFPNFPVAPFPMAGEPLYKAVEGSGNAAYITIHGFVSDATEVRSLSMVWINPKSRNFAAMSQLQYFRDAGYAGWAEAKKLLNSNGNVNSNKLETEDADTYDPDEVVYPYDENNPNRLWNLKLTPSGDDYGQELLPGTGEREPTNRKLFEFSVDIPLSLLNIQVPGFANERYLESQVFLFRVENPDKKTTIITYAPQGDVLSPKIKIENVVVVKDGEPTVCIPGVYNQVPQFTGGETITINGGWEEDSTTSLSVKDYLYNNMEFEINGIEFKMLDNPAGVNFSTPPGVVPSRTAEETAGNGTFSIIATVSNNGSTILDSRESYMRDTLVVNAKVIDIGGNPAETMASWLVESDTLRFLRLSSDDEDTAYKAGDTIEIFMEFNKPVKLKSGRSNPVLVLNTGGGATGTATYKTGQVNENVRQYFTYTVGAGQNIERLNVKGIYISGTIYETDTSLWKLPNYPLTWEHTSSVDNVVKIEEIRLTRDNSHIQEQQSASHTENGETFYTRALPVTTASGDSDYVFTLMGGKNIKIDTTGPAVLSDATGFTVSPTGWYKEGVEINITATFSENVKLSTIDDLEDSNYGKYVVADLPYLILGTGNANEANRRTSLDLLADNTPADIRVSNNKITFKYIVKPTDTTGTNPLRVTGFGGVILDIPGTQMSTDAVTGMSETNRTLTGGASNNQNVYLDTTAPNRPTVAIGTSSGGTDIASASNAITNRTLDNQYGASVYVTITGTSGDQNIGRIEYSLNGGQNWTSSTNSTINVPLTNNGSYSVMARQIDNAGNESGSTGSTTFNWDSGALVTSISSINNGTFTSNDARQDVVSIQVNFRKKLSFTGTPRITLNATGNGTKTVSFNGTQAERTNVDQLTFEYAVARNDTTKIGDTTNYNKLDVTALNLGATTDGGTTVPTDFINALPATASRLNALNEIYIVTGAMKVVTSPAQPVYTRSGTGEEWAGTIAITFDRPISKGSGNVTITQSTTGYRLPAVLTEAQSSRYRSARNFNANYTRGTNGFIATNNTTGGNPDTSTKYVLNYNVDTVVIPNNGGTAIQQMAYDFHAAESVTLPVTSQDISITNTATTGTLTITLADSNALQVLGAQYAIAIPSTFVQDNLGWPIEDALSYPYTTPEINKPFIRVNKQTNTDTINGYPTSTTPTNYNGSTTQPWLVAAQVLQTTARLDCRTPNSVVRYIANGTTHTATGVNTGDGTETAQWRNSGADTLVTYPNQGSPTTSSTLYGGTNGNDFTATIPVGTANEEGYVWRISTRSYRSNSDNEATYSNISDEVAFRSVLTVELTNMSANLGRRLESGDQLWIHGGDAKSSSSVPGYPLSWDIPTTAGTRAGIRLMRLTTTDNYTAAGNSEWRWISWEINVPTYFEIVLGRGVNDDNEPATGTRPSAQEAWWYGPRVYAPQRGGWAARDTFPINPGRHRWVRLNNSTFTPGGTTNFASSWQSRPYLAAP